MKTAYKTAKTNGEYSCGDLGTSSVFTPGICKPFFHMQHESFWRLVEINEDGYGMAAEPNPSEASKKERKELPKGSYSVQGLRRAFAYVEIDEMLFQLLQNGDARAMLRVVLINTYLTNQPTKTMPKLTDCGITFAGFDGII